MPDFSVWRNIGFFAFKAKFRIKETFMKRFVSFGLPVLVLALSLALISCGGNGAGDDNVNAEHFTATAETFGEILDSIRLTPGNYIITLTSDLLDFPGVRLYTAGVNITVRGDVASRRLSWQRTTDAPALFRADAGSRLTLENITLSRAVNTPAWALLVMEGGTIEMRNGVTVSNNDGITIFDSVSVRDSGTFIMSGGVIENSRHAIAIDGPGASVTISGGIIRNNNDTGVGIWGNENTINISGGTITGNERGVNVWGSQNTVNMSGGEIIGNFHTGAFVGNLDNINAGLRFNMSGGRISNNNNNGMHVLPGGSFIMQGGSISGSGNFGLFLEGANAHFEKRTGATIYGNDAGANSNAELAILVWTSSLHPENRVLFRTARSNEVFAATRNADNSGLVPGSVQGDWD